MINATTDKPFKLTSGKIFFATSGVGTVSLSIEQEGGQGASVVEIEAPLPYETSLPKCKITPTIPAGATLDVSYIDSY